MKFDVSAIDSARSTADLRFLEGGGAIAAALRAMDWSAHPLGQPQDWPRALKLSVSLCLRSGFPSAVYWGPHFRLIYNAAWAGTGDQAPPPLGLPAAEARRDIWETIAPHFAHIMATGETLAFDAQPLMMLRAGVPTETFWRYSSAPIMDEDGVPQGLFNQGLEITDRVLAERALRAATRQREFILTLMEEHRVLADPDDVMQLSAQAVGRHLDVDRAGFFEVTPAGSLDYGACWVKGPLAPKTGSISQTALSAPMRAAAGSGTTLIFRAADDVGVADPALITLIGAQAGVSVPLVRGGAWQGCFYVDHAEPRKWTRDEIALIEEVAELSWDAVARVRAVARLRAINADLTGEVAARTAERDRLWNVSNDLLGIAAQDGRWLAVNPAWERLLGWSADDILGRDTQWLRHPEDSGASAAEVARIAASGTTHRLEKRLRTRNGEYRTLAWQTTLVGDRLYSNARDITEERRQQAAARAADARTRLVLEALEGVGVWTYDVAQDRFESEFGFAALYGFTADQLAAGVSMADVAGQIHPEDLPVLHAAIKHAQTTGRDGAHEYRLCLPDGTERWVMARNHIQHDAEGHPEKVVGVAVDVTRQRELEERLRQSQKMEAVGQLTGGLAHDFNNLLTAISGALELMLLRLKQGQMDDLPRYIGAAQAGATRAAALTHRLLAFARRQPLDPRPVDVARLIGGMEDLVRRTLGPDIVLEIVTDTQGWPILADANQLENALLNLCINARDAMPQGGTVRIASENTTLDTAAAVAHDLAPGPYLVVSVTDTGAGMGPEVIARAFDPFFTTKPLGQGTGLGLSMIYGFVRQSGGQAEIRSTPGEGTTMRLVLPRSDGKVPALADVSGALDAAPAGAGEVVLVVDDEPSVRMLVSEVLSELGYTALEAETGAAALETLAVAERIDLLVTDVGLPGGMNGRQVADAARVTRPDLPVLFITGFAENAVVGDGPLDPGMALIAKPFAMEALAARIRAMLGAG